MSDLRLARVNRVHLSGRVVQDFALRYAPDNTPVAAFRLAFNRFVKQRDGSWQEIASFIGVIAAGRLAERCAEQLHKGSAVYLEGRLQSRSYRVANGRSHTVIDRLEQKLGKPVITSTQATLWHALRLAGIDDRIRGYGRLFDG